jgi:hypothetical protein
VEFSQDLRAVVPCEEITVSFRLWRRPRVKERHRYKNSGGQLEIDSAVMLRFSSIDESDLRLRPKTASNHSAAELPTPAPIITTLRTTELNSTWSNKS